MQENIWKPGIIIRGQYRLEKLLGQGGVGEVWRAEHLALRRKVAIKRLLSPGMSEEVRERFLREARTVAHLAHPAIVSVYDMTSESGLAFIVMEYVDGFDLSKLIGAEVLPLGRQIAIALDVSRGLLYAHGNGILHRDIKPANILIASSSGRPRYQILASPLHWQRSIQRLRS